MDDNEDDPVVQGSSIVHCGAISTSTPSERHTECVHIISSSGNRRHVLHRGIGWGWFFVLIKEEGNNFGL